MSRGYDFYVELEGSPRKRGEAHGEALRHVIGEGIDNWKALLSEYTNESPETFLGQFLSQADYLPAIERWTPGLLEELGGIGEGAGIDFDTIFAWQLFDEWIDFLLDRILAEKCTTIGVTGQVEHPTMIGKTQDLTPNFLGTHALLRIKYPESDREALVATMAGIVGQDGMNNRAVGACNNHIGHLRRATHGLPVSFFVRGLLEKETLKDAVKFTHAITHAQGMHYLIGGKEGMVSLEASAGKVSEYRPEKAVNRVCHTNHPLANDNYNDLYRNLPSVDDREMALTEARLKFAETALYEDKGSVTCDRMKSILSSREVPTSWEPGEDYVTAYAIVLELGEAPVMHFSPGPPSRNPFEVFTFS